MVQLIFRNNNLNSLKVDFNSWCSGIFLKFTVPPFRQGIICKSIISTKLKRLIMFIANIVI